MCKQIEAIFYWLLLCFNDDYTTALLATFTWGITFVGRIGDDEGKMRSEDGKLPSFGAQLLQLPERLKSKHNTDQCFIKQGFQSDQTPLRVCSHIHQWQSQSSFWWHHAITKFP
jgi:hypothetical protein